MRFTCNRTDLAGAVSTVERAVAGRDLDPPFTGVHLRASGGRLHLAATDLELGIACSIGADITEEGDIILEARTFGQMVRRLPGDEVALEILEDSRARLRAARVEYTVRTMRAEEFPGVHAPAAGTRVRLPENALRTMIRQTAYAAAADDSRLFLTGVLIKVETGGEEGEEEGPGLRFVATDSNRLATRRTGLAEAPAEPASALVPARALQELLRLLQDRGDAQVEMVLGEQQAAFEIGGTRLVTRLIEGTFPNYRHVIPRTNDAVVRLPRTLFIEALERAALLARRGPAVATLTVENGLMRIQAREADVGQVVEELDVAHEGENVQNSFQVRFLLDVLKALDGDEVTMTINGGDRQATVTAASEPDFLYIVMPVRLS